MQYPLISSNTIRNISRSFFVSSDSSVVDYYRVWLAITITPRRSIPRRLRLQLRTRERNTAPCHFIVHSCTVIITSDARAALKERILMPRQNQPRSSIVYRCYQPAAARVEYMCPPSTHSSRGPRTHAPFFFFIYVISNSHLLFHERCNTLMRAPTISLSKKKVEVGVDRLGARKARSAHRLVFARSPLRFVLFLQNRRTGKRWREGGGGGRI